ncbi:golvesin C-terminal-like domain-containing protein [Phytohabitans kaempferiae]|uniref:Golvesin/Xly CBD-like domain-containing protein n=1 Tax=Phytohabitans kaempferiae TaxID=1620943 RepID=A0ABV6MD99_9ACTN
MSFDARRWYVLALSGLLAVGGLVTTVASPAAAQDPPPPCEPGYQYYVDGPCDGGDGWIFNPPTFREQVGCGVSVLTSRSAPLTSYAYYYKNCNPPGGALECVTWVDPQLMLQNGSGRKYAGRYPGASAYLGHDSEIDNYQHPTNPYYGDDIIPSSIFVRTMEPGQVCDPRLGVPFLWAGTGPGGTDPLPPDEDDPCAGSNARCNNDGPDGGGDHGQAPHVTVFGQVVAPVNLVPPPGVGDRPLRDARYELWYYGKDGPGTAVQWRPVLSGSDSDHRPAGYPVRGNLDATGAYRLDFVYPQAFSLANGDPWEGCPDTGEAFLRSHTCAEAHLQLRVYPENANRSVVIVEDLEIEDDPLVMHTVNLGRFHQRLPGDQVTTATSEWALAYRGVYNVRDIWTPTVHPNVTVRIHDEGGSYYNPTTSIVNLNRSSAGYHGIEHETAHRYLHHVYGFVTQKEPECQTHEYTEASGPKCAFAEGLANFVAVAAQGSTRYQLNAAEYDEIEECLTVILSGTYTCEPGASVEGNVAGSLWDLYDSGLELDSRESWTGLSDEREVPFMTIMSVIASAKPETAHDFWRAWVSSSPYRAPDRELALLNRISLISVVDAEPTGASGEWTETACDRCTGGGYLVRSQYEDGSHVWDLSDDIPASQPSTYDLWVRLPGGHSELDPDARYRVTVQGGVEEASVDQSAASGGWINLRAAGFLLDPSEDVTVTLVNGALTPGTPLMAEGLLVAVHTG